MLHFCFSISLVRVPYEPAQAWRSAEAEPLLLRGCSSQQPGCPQPHGNHWALLLGCCPFNSCFCLSSPYEWSRANQLDGQDACRKTHKRILIPLPPSGKLFPAVGKGLVLLTAPMVQEGRGISRDTWGQNSYLQTWAWGSRQIPG